jgi:opacity protein-like surface antigen
VRAQSAEATFSLAVDSASAPRPTLLFAFGLAPRPVGFEIEYAGSAGSGSHGDTTVRTVAGSLFVTMPWKIRGSSVYATSGVGVYTETGGASHSGQTGAVHVGAGVSIPFSDVWKWRVEYRVLTLFEAEGPVASTHPQRLTTGLSVGF